MHELRLFSIIAWIALPTVMYGGYALFGFLTRGALTPFQETFFRAGHAHAGVLLLMSLLYHRFIEQTSLSPALKVGRAVIVLVGILAQSGGFFLHLVIGQPDAPSFGTTLTSLGAVLLAAAVLLLVYGLITIWPMTFNLIKERQNDHSYYHARTPDRRLSASHRGGPVVVRHYHQAAPAR